VRLWIPERGRSGLPDWAKLLRFPLLQSVRFLHPRAASISAI
jgi:hypothetical protein